MEHSDLVPKYLGGSGVEIGAFKTPIPGIRPVYVDRFASYAGEPTLADYYGDACELPFLDSSLDYVATSHVLEHVANPVAAVREWIRVLRHGEIIYMVVPDRRLTFDRLRPLTLAAHIVDDFQKGTTQVDGTHIDDFVYGIDWSLFSPATSPENVQAERERLADSYRRAVQDGQEINIHFHTFEPKSVTELIEVANAQQLWGGVVDLLETVSPFPSSNPNGFLIVGRVKKPLRQRLRSLWAARGLSPTARVLRPAT